jgi:hypothetical protein
MPNEVRFRASLKDDVSAPIGKIDSAFDRIGKNKAAQSVLTGVGVGAGISAYGLLGQGIGAVKDVIGGSMKAASDLNEQVNKSQAIFKGSSREVIAFGDSAAKTFGISKREALEAAGNFGNLFNTIGLGSGVSADMSTKLVGLAADLASFNNIDPGDALEKLRSGLAGEAEPLRTVGVLLNETQVASEAMRLGFVKVNGQFTEGEKVQARYSLILKQTSAAQGDFERTSGTMANQQRTVNARLDDTSAKLGEKFTPIAIRAQEGTIDLVAALELAGQGLEAIADTATHATDPMHFFRTKVDEARWAAMDADDTLSRSERSIKTLGKATDTTAGQFDNLAEKVKVDMALTRDSVKTEITDLTSYIHERLTTKALKDILAGKSSLGKQLATGLKNDLPDVKQRAEDIRDELTRILNARVGVTIHVSHSGGGGLGKFAQGGRVRQGVPSIVGEEGEELFVPDSSGTIFDAQKTRRWLHGGGSVGGGPVIQVAISPGVITGEVARQIVAAIEDDIIRMLRRRGLTAIGAY